MPHYSHTEMMISILHMPSRNQIQPLEIPRSSNVSVRTSPDPCVHVGSGNKTHTSKYMYMWVGGKEYV